MLEKNAWISGRPLNIQKKENNFDNTLKNAIRSLPKRNPVGRKSGRPDDNSRLMPSISRNKIYAYNKIKNGETTID